ALAQAEISGHKAEGINKFFAEEVFGLADPKRYNQTGITLLDALDIAAGRIDAKFPNDPSLRAEILDQLGEIYIGIDKPSRAVPALRQAIELRRALAGDKDPALLRSRSRLGWALLRVGRWDDSKATLQSVLDDQTAVLGPGNPDTVQSAHDLIVVLLDLRGMNVEPRPGDKDLEIAQNAYQSALTTLGPKHRSTLIIEDAVAWVLRWRNRSAEALPYTREAAEGLKAVV